MRIAAVLLAAALGLASAAQAAGPAAYKAPRNTFGQPDFEGFWTNATLTPIARDAKFGGRGTYTPDEVRQIEGNQQAALEKGNQATDPSVGAPAVGGIVTPRGGTQIDGNYNRGWFDPGNTVMRVGGEARNSLLTTPNGQFPPRKAGAAAAPRPGPPARPAGSGPYDNPEQLGAGNRCIISFGRNGGPPMFSNGFYNNNYQIVQSKDAIAINIEMVHDTRIIRLNGQHRSDGVRPWFGDSIGHWQGESLVVETTNIPQAQAYAGSWENLKVTETFTRVGKDRLRYQFTLEDPTMWDKPWGGEYEFSTLNGRVLEYACHEGNYALEGILAGARAEEAKAREKAATR
ncbi:MAG TPA: hypothetical protein VFN88_07735 [Caulobacteraceae bacterium]|nr:hypothetical protein [Caulobacteraceae bacterium]